MSRMFSASLGLLALVACNGEKYIDLEPAQLEISTDILEFGEHQKGQPAEKTVTLSNGGDVPLGIGSIALASSENPDRGHVGAFKLSWNCDNVEAPDSTGDEDERNPNPAPDTGSDPETGDEPETGDIDTGNGGNPPVGKFACVIPPGGILPVRVKFLAEVAGENWDALIVTTKGEEEEDPSSTDDEGEAAPSAGSPDEIVHRDLDNLWKMVYLHGSGLSDLPNALVQPKTVDFGFVYQSQNQLRYLTIRNVGDGDLTVNEIKIDDANCSDGYEISSKPENGSVISGGMSKVVELRYTPVTDREAQCYVLVSTSDPDKELERVLLKSNSGTNPANEPPSVVVHSPANGYQHVGTKPISIEMTVFDANEPASNLYCSVRSALQGWEYGKPGVATCRPSEGNESGHLTVDVPFGDGEFVQNGSDVLLVRVTDDSGVTREASISVLINADYPETDDDGDGFGTTDPMWPDCDDTNINTYPFAAEIADGKDNDCDRIIDEGTNAFDDDGDGMSEEMGDCNDANPDTYKGAPEIPDGADNDCDGIVDDNTTAYDDDGDGFAELYLDCNDRDPTVHPAAAEICDDGIDNNCNSQKDSADVTGCIAKDSKPMIIGRINLSRTSVEEGGVVQASVRVFEADGDVVTHDWAVNTDGVIDDPSSPAITWTGPDNLPTEYRDGNVYRLQYLASDDDGHQDWIFQEIWMYRRGTLDIQLQKPAENSGCSVVGAAPAGIVGLLTLVAVAARRRRHQP
jgi:MYXO-CTERM domain-containing protein